MFKKNIEIFRKIGRHGIVMSFKIFLRIFNERVYIFCLTRIPWALKFRFYYHLARLLFMPNLHRKRRILGIWDFKALPWSVGDPLAFIETLSVLKVQYDAEEVDVCIVYDRDSPAGNRGRMNSSNAVNNITCSNAQDYMLEFLPLFSTSPYLGSVYQFNSRKEFYYFLKNNLQRYNIFPSLVKHLSETYNFYCRTPVLKEIIEFYNDNGYIPHLRVGSRDRSWAKWFYVKHLPENSLPVSLSLKRTGHAVDRNIEPVVWLSFIDKCRLDFPEVVFVIVGLREEAFEGLRNRPNVIIAKDFGTSLIEDLALIRASLLYMGTSSGVNLIAWFSSLPYLVFQMPADNLHRHGLKTEEGFPFLNNKQKNFITTEITAELLFDEFRKLYLELDKNEWRKKVLENVHFKYGHPTARVEGFC